MAVYHGTRPEFSVSFNAPELDFATLRELADGFKDDRTFSVRVDGADGEPVDVTGCRLTDLSLDVPDGQTSAKFTGTPAPRGGVKDFLRPLPVGPGWPPILWGHTPADQISPAEAEAVQRRHADLAWWFGGLDRKLKPKPKPATVSAMQAYYDACTKDTAVELLDCRREAEEACKDLGISRDVLEPLPASLQSAHAQISAKLVERLREQLDQEILAGTIPPPDPINSRCAFVPVKLEDASMNTTRCSGNDYEPLTRPEAPTASEQAETVAPATHFYYDPEADRYGVQTSQTTPGGVLLDLADFLASQKGTGKGPKFAGWIEHATTGALILIRDNDGVIYNHREGGTLRRPEFGDPAGPWISSGRTDPRYLVGTVADGEVEQ